MFDMTLTELTILAYKTCVYTWMVTYTALIWRGALLHKSREGFIS